MKVYVCAALVLIGVVVFWDNLYPDACSGGISKIVEIGPCIDKGPFSVYCHTTFENKKSSITQMPVIGQSACSFRSRVAFWNKSKFPDR